jgi:chemotaxis protein CheD
VCLWDANLHIGGMNHFLLPAGREGQGTSMRFGDMATCELLKKLLALGSHKRDLIAKIFGGAALFRTEDRYKSSLGAKNVECARSMMAKASISIAAEDTGGNCGRKIVFHTDDGSAWSRQV